VRERVVKSDSLRIFITTNDSVPFFLIAPKQIRINDKYYNLPDVNTDSHIEYTLPYSPVNYFIINGYQIYKTKNKRSNYFHFTIKEVKESRFEYSGGTFFKDEKFLIKGDTLYKLRNNEVNITFVKNK
jgi:hypothetical protein